MPSPLELLPAPALAYTLGLCMGRKQKPETAQQITALIGELRRRGVYSDMVAALHPDLQQALVLMEGLSRGQAWNQGRRPS